MKIKLTTMHYILIVFIIFGGLLIYSYKYNNNKFYREYMECHYLSDDDEYQENMTFTYDKSGLIGFYREEIVITEAKKNIDNIKKTYEEVKKEYEENNVNCKYDLEEKDGKIIITTFIDVSNDSNLFNQYFSQKNISNKMGSYDIKEALKESFSCNLRVEE